MKRVAREQKQRANLYERKTNLGRRPEILKDDQSVYRIPLYDASNQEQITSYFNKLRTISKQDTLETPPNFSKTIFGLKKLTNKDIK